MAIKVEVFVSDTCPHCPGAVVVANEAKEVLGDAMDIEVLNIADGDNRQRAIDYQIMAVPTIAVNNEVAFVGAPTKDQLIEKIESLL
ncbi:MAG: thioredoxin family protein [Methanobrevibacter sp.]|nr:thioredoxin family protein [Methanobrevibacter sp.]